MSKSVLDRVNEAKRLVEAIRLNAGEPGHHQAPEDIPVGALVNAQSGHALAPASSLDRPHQELMDPSTQKEKMNCSTPAEWLIALRLNKYTQDFERIGVRQIIDFAEVQEEDLEAMEMPKLQARRFLTAAQEIPIPAQRPLRAADTVAALLSRAQQLAELPTGGAVYDTEMLGRAVEEVASAASAVQSKALEPNQWLEDFRLDLFSVNFDGLGVEILPDFTEVTQDDLDGMAMPLLQQRRFKKRAAEIPNPGGPHGMAALALQRCQEARAADAVLEWLRTLRLTAWQVPLAECGVRELADFAEVLEEELHLMGLPPLQRRRYLTAAARAAGAPQGTPAVPADAVVRAMAEKAADSPDCVQYLRALRLADYAQALLAATGLGCEDPTDFREVLISDLDALMMPPIQQRRFLAAKRLLPEQPETMGRRWETPPKWLEAIRLGRFWPPLQTIGVDRVCDFAEILDSDLDDIGMPRLLQRRFRLCVSKDVQNTQIAALGALAITDGSKPPGPDGSMANLKAAGVDVIAMAPARWLSAIRCEAFLESFERLGVEKVVDFTEVLFDDLLDMQLPLLHRRRFAQAAAEADALWAQQKALQPQQKGQTYGVEAASAIEWLRELRLDRFVDSFRRLGIEQIEDFPEVLHSDLVAMGMPPLQMRRFLKGVAGITARR